MFPSHDLVGAGGGGKGGQLKVVVEEPGDFEHLMAQHPEEAHLMKHNYN